MSISVGEGFPQRHQGYQTQQAQIWACTSAELRGGTRNALVVADEDGVIQKTRTATVHRNTSQRDTAYRKRTLWIYNHHILRADKERTPRI